MSTSRQTLSLYWRFTRPYKKQLWQIYPAMVVAQVAEEAIAPVLISSVLTNLAAGNTSALTIDKVWPILALIVALDIFGHLMWNRVIIKLFWRTQDRIMRDLTMHV